jgi:hypothetical protein
MKLSFFIRRWPTQPAPAGPPLGALVGCPVYIADRSARFNATLHAQRAPVHIEQRFLLFHIGRLLLAQADELTQHLYVESG